MEKLFIILIFLSSVTFLSYSFSEWIENDNTISESSAWYYASTHVSKNNEFVNYWELTNYASDER